MQQGELDQAGHAQGESAPGHRASWSRRLVRIGLRLLVVGALGLLLGAGIAGAAMTAASDDMPYDGFRAEAADFPMAHGPTEVVIEEQSVLAIYYDADAIVSGQGSPQGTCIVEGPDGQALEEVGPEPMRSPVIDGHEYYDIEKYRTVGPGTYSVACSVEGLYAGPGYLSSEPSPTVDAEGAATIGMILALLLIAVGGIAVPVLLAALIVRLVAGPRAESRERVRFERPLASAIVLAPVVGAAGVATVMAAVNAMSPAVTAAGIAQQRQMVLVAGVVLVVLLLALALETVLAVRRSRVLRRTSPSVVTEP